MDSSDEEVTAKELEEFMAHGTKPATSKYGLFTKAKRTYDEASSASERGGDSPDSTMSGVTSSQPQQAAASAHQGAVSPGNAARPGLGVRSGLGAKSQPPPPPRVQAESQSARGGGGGKVAPPAYSQFRSDRKKVDKSFAQFEKHTKGFGQKMMMKMGWKPGEGIGIAKHGITQPIEAKLRKRGMALQDEGERTEQSRRDFGDAKHSEDEEEQEFREALWRARGRTKASRKEKVQYSYKTADSLLGTPVDTEQAKPVAMKIMDMRGEHERVISSLAGVNQEPARRCFYKAANGEVPFPHLQYNILTLGDLAESDVHQANNKVRAHTRRLEALKEDKQEMKEKLKVEKQDLDALRKTLATVKELAGAGAMKPKECAEVFLRMRTDHARDFERYQLNQLALSVALPPLQRSMQGWSPLKDPELHLAVFKMWRKVLQTSKPRHERIPNPDDMYPFEKMVWNAVLPGFRAAFRDWSPTSTRGTTAAVKLLKAWETTLPRWVQKSIIAQMILPKLQTAVEDWRPGRDSTPIHLWFHPWVSAIPREAATLYPTIRHRLTTGFRSWEPGDKSGCEALRPWVAVFSASEMGSLLGRSVYPKLKRELERLNTNPTKLNLAPLAHAAQWVDTAPTKDLCDMVETTFGPKFLNTTCHWLSLDKVDCAEVAVWYGHVKRALGDFASFPAIQAYLYRALTLMDGCLVDEDQGVARLAATMRDLQLKSSKRSSSKTHPPSGAQLTRPGTVNIHDLLQTVASREGISYHPSGKLTSDGKQLYSFGHCSVYIEQDVLHCKVGSKYQPMDLDELLKIAQSTS
eukprot:m.116434 g.116434  ORF g.116434 m.116434 type:complete len:805 (-) comp13610_c0_seq1:83-2497(-)